MTIIRCLSLEFLDTAEIRIQCVVLERVHPFEELNEKKFRERFRLSKHATLYGKSHSQQTTPSNIKHERLAYHVLEAYVVNTYMILEWY